MARVFAASLPLALVALIAFASVAVRADEECDEMMTGFHDNDLKSQAWQDIAHSNVKAVTTAIDEDPCYAKMRAADGRGPLFWAHEFYNQKIIDALAKDKGGKTPTQMPRAPPMTFEAPEEPDDEYEPDDDDDEYGAKDHSEM